MAVLLAGQLLVAPAWAQGDAATAPTLDEAPKVSSPSDSPAPGSAAPELASEEPAPATISRMDMLLASLTIFVLAIFVGFEIITKVPPTLHTPLMSGSNAISGITIVGALIVAGTGLGFAPFLGFTAVILATVNVVGGFLVTHRMLAMFKKR
jgi:NAD(P) transhydrogenase subunit alpha